MRGEGTQPHPGDDEGSVAHTHCLPVGAGVDDVWGGDACVALEPRGGRNRILGMMKAASPSSCSRERLPPPPRATFYFVQCAISRNEPG